MKIKKNYEKIEEGLYNYRTNITEKNRILEEDIIKIERYESSNKLLLNLLII